MARAIKPGDCVRLPDGRIGRLRDIIGAKCRVRVRRVTSETHQFVMVPTKELEPVECPKGWMSPEGYRSYLKTTLAKMRERQAHNRSKRATRRKK
jgi:hypothetical protein